MSTVYQICLAASAESEEWLNIDDLGIVNPERVRLCAATDTLTFEVKGQTAFTDESLFAYRALIRFRRLVNGVPALLFLGRVQPHERVCDPSESYSVEVRGMWDWFEDTPMRQDWVENGASVKTPRVILFCDGAGARMSTGAQIEQCVAVAIAAGCPCASPATGDIDAGFTPPFDEQVNVMVSDAVCKALANHPHASCWFDYSERAPRLRVRTRQSLTANGIDVAGKVGIRVKSREDLQPPAVAIAYEKENSADGSTWRETFVDYAPVVADEAAQDTDARLSQSGVLWGCFDLQGSSQQTVSQKIEVEAIPVTMDGRVGWLKEHIPMLKDFSDIDIELESFSRSSARTHPLANVLVKGAIQNWMGVDWERETFSAVVNLINEVDGEEVERRTETLKLEVVTTSATTKTYKTTAAFDAGETIPVGVAAALWVEWQQLHHEGSVSIAEEEPSLIYGPGTTVDLLNGRSEWATMKAMVIRVTEKFAGGETDIEFGVPGWIDIDSRVAWYRSCRTRRYAFSRSLRDATADDGGGGVADTASKRDGGNVGHLKRRRLMNPKARVVHEIDLNTEDCTGDTKQVLKPREVAFSVDSDGETKTEYRQILCGEPYSDPAEDADDPCSDHSSGGDGVSADGGDGGVSGDGGDGGVSADGSDDGDGGSASGCASQCDI